MTPADQAVEECRAALNGRRVLLCVGGGIAAYKACELARLFVRSGAVVDAAMTPGATKFVTPLTLQALTQRPVATSLLDAAEEQQIGHIGLADRAELVVVAPATADLAARLRAGMADDVVTATLLATNAPVLLAPSMNVRMWAHPATRENFETLRWRGLHQVGPGSGEMACGHVGDGRLAEPWEILRAAAAMLSPRRDLVGKRLLVTAGPTHEHLDPVRFLSNPSSGRMGFALAAAAARRGATVTLVAGPVELATPAGVERIDVVSAAGMAAAVHRFAEQSDLVLMSAAVSDYRPAQVASQKVKKSPGAESIVFERTEDILLSLGERFAGRTSRPVLIGFAAETERVLEYAREKLVRKKVDAVVANRVGPGGAFGAPDNEVTLVLPDRDVAVPRASKEAVAEQLLDLVVPMLVKAGSAS